MDEYKKCEFKEEVFKWAWKIKVKPARLRIQKMRNKWASCSSSGCVTFNEALLGGDNELKDYVIVHDLLHLRVPNHGKLFKGLLESYLPGNKYCDCHYKIVKNSVKLEFKYDIRTRKQE